MERKTNFGFRVVNIDEKQKLVNQVFASVARRYDLMNDLMSGGMHRLWKDELINWLAPPRSALSFKLLDVAGGTGDIAIKFLKCTSEGCDAVICDISEEMLQVGREKINEVNFADRSVFIGGNAECLPFPDCSFDAYTIAFGIRNVTHLEETLGEAFRVLRPGGRFLCLEFSDVQVPMLDKIYELYSFRAIPVLGAVAARDSDSYRYLVESIRKFPDQETFVELIENAGFSQTKYRNLSGGIAAIHSGWRV